MNRINKLYLAALELVPDHIKALVNIDHQQQELPMIEIRNLLDEGKISYTDIVDIIPGGNDLKDLDAWLSIMRDIAYLKVEAE